MSISRRTVVQGAAWSVPVLAVASVAPVASASPYPINFTAAGDGGKCPGNSVGCDLANKSYIFPIDATSSYDKDIEVTITATWNNQTYPIDAWKPAGSNELIPLKTNTISVPAGSSSFTCDVSGLG